MMLHYTAFSHFDSNILFNMINRELLSLPSFQNKKIKNTPKDFYYLKLNFNDTTCLNRPPLILIKIFYINLFRISIEAYIIELEYIKIT
jgi:hypothetical protein